MVLRWLLASLQSLTCSCLSLLFILCKNMPYWFAVTSNNFDINTDCERSHFPPRHPYISVTTHLCTALARPVSCCSRIRQNSFARSVATKHSGTKRVDCHLLQHIIDTWACIPQASSKHLRTAAVTVSFQSHPQCAEENVLCLAYKRQHIFSAHCLFRIGICDHYLRI